MIYFIAFFAPFFYALSIILESCLSLNIFKKPSTMCFFVSCTNSLFVPLLFFLGFPTFPESSAWILYFLIAAIDIAYLYPYYIALKKTDTSVVSALFGIGTIFIPILSFIFLDDVLTPVQYIGFFIVIFASVILNLNKTKGLKLNAAFYLMFLSSFLLSCRMILAKAALQIDTNWINVMVYPHIISGTLAFLFLFPKKFRKDICK